MDIREQIKTDPTKWVHLHIHDDYSLLDGFARVEEYAEEAKNRGYKHLAITNHGIVGQIPRQYKACKKHGLTPIYACEIYLNEYRKLKHLTLKDNTEPMPKGFADQDEFKKAFRKNIHLCLIAKNQKGFENLIKITSDAWINGFYFKPRSDIDMIEKHSDGLICGSACLSGPINHLIRQGKHFVANLLAQRLKKIFGDDFYIELMLLDIELQMDVTPHLINIAKENNIRLVLTNDSHYLNKEDSYYQDIMLLMQNGSTVEDMAKGDAFEIHTKDLWYKTVDELDEMYINLLEKYPDLEDSFTPEIYKEAKENVWYYAEKCHVEIDTTPKFPRYIPNSKKEQAVYRQHNNDSNEFLRSLVFQGLKKRNLDQQAYRERLEKELDVIKRKNYADYFLTVRDMVQYAHRNSIPVGPGRGSAAGALMCYCLGITDVDPLDFQLLFERFLNEGRADFPDIDLDFGPDGREQIKTYINQRWEKNVIAHRLATEYQYSPEQIQEAFENNTVPFEADEARTCSIGTYGTFQTKSTILDVCRAFAVPLDTARMVSKSLPPEIDDYSLGEIMMNPELKEWKELLLLLKDYTHIFKHGEEEKEISVIDAVFCIRGRQKNLSKHAAGVIISNVDLRTSLPLVTRDGNIISSWIEGLKGNELSQFGFIKYDILGLQNLIFIRDALQMINQRHGVNLSVGDIDKDLNDPEVYKSLRKGHSALIFQFESNLMRRLLKDTDCDSFECLTAVSALGRPGPLQSGMTEMYSKRKLGKEEYELEDVLQPILGSTYGVFCFQEQVMSVAHTVGGLTLVETDNLRKILIKFKKDAADEIKEKFNTYRSKFIEGAQRYFTQEKSIEMFDGFAKWASYGFNKCFVVNTRIFTHFSGEEGVTIGEVLKNGNFVGLEIKAKDKNQNLTWDKIKDICYNGKKPVFRITVESGCYVEATANHRFYSTSGWKELQSFSAGDNIGMMFPKKTYAQWDKVTSIEYIGIEDTYDIEMCSDEHNFVANNFISHNSHSVCYTIISYRCAWLKAHYPLEYICAVLSNVSKGESGTGKGKKNRYQEYIQEAMRLGIKILPPDINCSNVNFSITQDGQIRIGFTSIKGITEENAKPIVEAAPYANFEDFLKRAKYTKKNVIPLILVGAFDCFGDRMELYIKYFIHRKEKWHKELERYQKKDNYVNSMCGNVITRLGEEYGKPSCKFIKTKKGEEPIVPNKDDDPEVGDVNSLDNKWLSTADLSALYEEIKLNEEEKDRLFFEEFGFALLHPVHTEKVYKIRAQYIDRSLIQIKSASELNEDKKGSVIALLKNIYKSPMKKNPDKFFYSLLFEDGYDYEDTFRVTMFEEEYEIHKNQLIENEIYITTCKAVPNYNMYNPVGYLPFVKFDKDGARSIVKRWDCIDKIKRKSLAKDGIETVEKAGHFDDHQVSSVFGYIKSIQELKRGYRIIVADMEGQMEVLLWKVSEASLRKDKSEEIIQEMPIGSLVRMRVRKLEDGYNGRKSCEYVTHKKYNIKF